MRIVAFCKDSCCDPGKVVLTYTSRAQLTIHVLKSAIRHTRLFVKTAQPLLWSCLIRNPPLETTLGLNSSHKLNAQAATTHCDVDSSYFRVAYLYTQNIVHCSVIIDRYYPGKGQSSLIRSTWPFWDDPLTSGLTPCLLDLWIDHLSPGFTSGLLDWLQDSWSPGLTFWLSTFELTIWFLDWPLDFWIDPWTFGLTCSLFDWPLDIWVDPSTPELTFELLDWPFEFWIDPLTF